MSARRWLRVAMLTLVVLLFVLSIPWYRDPGEAGGLWLGLPEWVAVALLCYVGAALANAAAWLLTDFDDADGELPIPLDDADGELPIPLDDADGELPIPLDDADTHGTTERR